jgi:uncharacterized membrane protein YkvA (DUF1232 family)
MPILPTLRAWAKRLKRDALTLWFACRHPDTPWPARALGVFVVAYALSPIDLIPDFVPLLGYLDDLVLLPGLIWLVIWLTPSAVLDDCRRQADEWIARGEKKPRSLWGAVVITGIWFAISWLIWQRWLEPLLRAA